MSTIQTCNENFLWKLSDDLFFHFTIHLKPRASPPAFTPWTRLRTSPVQPPVPPHPYSSCPVEAFPVRPEIRTLRYLLSSAVFCNENFPDAVPDADGNRTRMRKSHLAVSCSKTKLCTLKWWWSPQVIPLLLLLIQNKTVLAQTPCRSLLFIFDAPFYSFAK